jgi:hypothetical protein
MGWGQPETHFLLKERKYGAGFSPGILFQLCSIGDFEKPGK